MCGRKTRAHESVESNKIVKPGEHLKSIELVKSSDDHDDDEGWR